jgi:hypothetical protein
MNERSSVWLLRLTAGTLLVLCGAATAMLALHRSAHPVVGPYSFPAFAAMVLAGASCAGLAAIVLLPTAAALRLHKWLGEGTQSLRLEPLRGTARAGCALVLLAILSHSVIGFRLARLNREALHDQADYLNVAADIHRMGLAELWGGLWGGNYREANRHPLYTALLSLRPEFEWAKFLSWLLGLITLAILLFGTLTKSGGLVAGLSTVLVATNSVFQQSASLVACEMLLMLWALLAWLTIERCIRDCSAARESLVARTVARCAAIGLWLGLAYLTKASAFFLLIGFVVWSAIVPQLRRWSWLALVSFAVVSSPLLVRNVRTYGDPLYSFNNRFLFADSFEQGVERGDRGTWADAKQYFETHSMREIGRRALGGLAWEAFILLRSLGPASLSDSRPLVGLVILLLSVLGTIGADRRLVLAMAAWVVPFYVFFAWYGEIARGDRFLAPVIPVLLVFAARGAISLLQANALLSPRQLERRLLIGVALWCIAITVLSFKGTTLG